MMTALILVAAWPLLRTIYFSFTDTSLSNLGGGKWIGFDNYLTWRTLSLGQDASGAARSPIRPGGTRSTTPSASRSSRSRIETVLGLMVALVLNAEFDGPRRWSAPPS